MYKVTFVFKSYACELVQRFDSFTAAWTVANEYRAHPDVSHAAVVDLAGHTYDEVGRRVS